MSDSPITPSTRFESYMSDISSNLENIAQKMAPEGTGEDDSGATELYKLEPATRFESYMSDISGKLEQIAQNVTPGGGGGGGDGLPTTGGTMSGSIDMDGNAITNLPQTSTSGDAVSYGQVDQMLTEAIDERKLGGSKTAAQVTDGTLNVAANVGMIYNLSEDLTLTDQTKSAFVPNGKTTYPVGSRLVVVEYDGTYRFDAFPGFLDLEKTAQNAEESYQKKQRVPVEFTYSIQASLLILYDGSVVSFDNANYKVTSAVDVSGYDRIYVSACANFGNNYYAFYTSGGTFISGKRVPGNNSTASYYSGEVTVPQNAATVRVAYFTKSGNRLPEHIISHYEYADVDIPTYEKFTEIPGTIASGKYIDDSHTVANANGWNVMTANLDQSDTVLFVSGDAYAMSYYYMFLGENDAFISGGQPPTGTTGSTYIRDVKVVVPAGAKKILVSGNKAYSASRISGYELKKKWAGKKWAAVGDSLTEVNTRTTMHYHDYIAKNTGIEVVNMGVSGSGYRRKNDTNQAFYQRIVNVPTDADVVTIFGSFNDGVTDIGTADDTGTTTVGGCVNATIDALYSVMPTVQLGIVSPTPWSSHNPYDHTDGNDYADLLEAICKKRSIPFLNLYYESNLRPWDSTFIPLAYSKDDGGGVHPDETGHKIIAPRFEAFLDSLLQSSS